MAEYVGSKATIASEEIEVGEIQEEIAERFQKDEKSRLNVEILEDTATAEPVYQIRPQLHERFKPLSAKEVIHNVLFDQLSAKTYDAQESAQWTKDIADLIREKVKELKFKRYKYIVNVVLGEQHGAGVKMGTRCIWDAEADAYAYDSFLNVGTMATNQSSMTEFHFVVKNLAYCTRAVHLIAVFRKYGVEHVEVRRRASGKNRAFLSFISLDSADIALNAAASGIYLHSKRLELQYTSYYIKSKMAITPPVATDYENKSICSVLPIEIISKIIGYLPYEDQGRLERVSKLWRLASLCSHSELKHFGIDYRWPSGWRGMQLTHKCFYWLMNRSKRYVRSLTVSNYAVLNDMSRILAVAVKSCPHLHEVNFRETLFTMEMAKDLCFIAPRLTAITLGRSKGPIEPLLTVIFKEAKKFATLKLVRTIITGESFAYLNTDLESLTVEHCHHIESRYMCKAIERFRCLKYLEISTCMKMNENILRALIRNTSISKTIETLKLSYCPIPIPNCNSEQIPQFEHHEFYIECKPGPSLLGVSLVRHYTNIKHLTLKFCGWVTEEVVSEIAKNLSKLEYLDLSGCTNIVGVLALNPLSKLTNITTINLNHLRPAVDGSVLKEFKKLKQISCRNSLGFNNTAICGAINNCPYLSKVVIEDCPNVGEPVIQCALSIIRDNDRTLPLIIYVNGSGITESMEFTQNEILEICDDRLYFPAYEMLLPGQGRKPFFCYMS